MKLQGQRTHLAAPLIASLALLSSCRGPRAEDQGPPEVVNPAPAPESILGAKEIFRIGRGQGEGPDVFGRIDVLAVDPRGNVYLVDGLANEIRVFGANGEHRRSFGREGEGPGELEGVRGVAFHPDGTVWVWDHSLQRFRVPFEGGRGWTLEPDGSGWFTDGHAYRILRREANGDTVLAFSLDVEPPRVTQAELDSVLGSMSGWPPDQALDPSVIPETRASVDRLVRLAPGWLGAFPHVGAETGQILDVFTPAGTHRARIDLGIALSLTSPAPCWRSGRLFGVVRDEMDVQYVVALDLGLDELRGDASTFPDG